MKQLGEQLERSQHTVLARHFKASEARVTPEDLALVEELFSDCRKRLSKLIKLGAVRANIYVTEHQLELGKRSALDVLVASSHPLRWHRAVTLPDHPFNRQWRSLKEWARRSGLYVSLRSEPDAALSQDDTLLEAWPL